MMRESEENRAFKVVCWTAVLALVVQPVPMAFAAGDGTFGPNTDFPTGVTPLSVALADVDGDGDLDVVTANLNSNNISVLLGDGSGGFGATTDFPLRRFATTPAATSA